MKDIDRRMNRIRNRLVREAAVRLALAALLWVFLSFLPAVGAAVYPLRIGAAILVLVVLPELFYKYVGLKSGRRAKITYSADGPPKLSAKIQDLYGTNSLAIVSGRVPVRIEILAPNQRPVQVTDNLANFWRETYPKLKIELQRKYPRHEWR